MSNTITIENPNRGTTVAVADAVALIQLAGSIELTRMEAAELRAKFLALLPFASDEQFAEVRAAAEGETETAEGCRVNVDFKLTAEQETILKGAREDRKAHLMENKEKYVGEIAADASQKLVSLKVRVGAKKTSTTMRFEKSMTKPVGLMAHLRELAKDL